MVVDTSALIAILRDEPECDLFSIAIVDAPVARISSATLIEAGVVTLSRLGQDAVSDLDRLVQRFELKIEPLSKAEVGIARGAYMRFGKGRHPARLNFGDTFSYALAMHLKEPLLFKGADLALTDVTPAVSPAA